MKYIIPKTVKVVIVVLSLIALPCAVSCPIAAAQDVALDEGADDLDPHPTPVLDFGGGAFKPDDGTDPLVSPHNTPLVFGGGAHEAEQRPCPQYSGIGARFAGVAAALGAEPCPQDSK